MLKSLRRIAIGEPCEGKLHARFDEGAVETCRIKSGSAPRSYSATLAAVILDDKELERILAHQGWPVAFAKTKASRAPPDQGEASGEGSQANARGEADEVRQDFPSEDPA